MLLDPEVWTAIPATACPSWCITFCGVRAWFSPHAGVNQECKFFEVHGVTLLWAQNQDLCLLFFTFDKCPQCRGRSRQYGEVNKALNRESGDLYSIPRSATGLLRDFGKVTSPLVASFPLPSFVCLVYLECKLFRVESISCYLCVQHLAQWCHDLDWGLQVLLLL